MRKTKEERIHMGNTFFFTWEPALMVWLQSHLGSFGDRKAHV